MANESKADTLTSRMAALIVTRGKCYEQDATAYQKVVDTVLNNYEYVRFADSQAGIEDTPTAKLEWFDIGRSHRDKDKKEVQRWASQKENYDTMIVFFSFATEKEAQDMVRNVIGHTAKDPRSENKIEHSPGRPADPSKVHDHVVYIALKYRDIFKHFSSTLETVWQRAISALRKAIDDILREEHEQYEAEQDKSKPKFVFQIGLTRVENLSHQIQKGTRTCKPHYVHVLAQIGEGSVPTVADGKESIATPEQYAYSLHQALHSYYLFESPSEHYCIDSSTQKEGTVLYVTIQRESEVKKRDIN